MENQENQGKVRFIPAEGGKFIWKIYDALGSVIAKAEQLFDNEESCRADFNAYVEANSELLESADEANTGAPIETAPAETAPAEVNAPAETAPIETPENAPAEIADGQPVEQTVPENNAANDGAANGSADTAGSATL